MRTDSQIDGQGRRAWQLHIVIFLTILRVFWISKWGNENNRFLEVAFESVQNNFTHNPLADTTTFLYSLPWILFLLRSSVILSFIRILSGTIFVMSLPFPSQHLHLIASYTTHGVLTSTVCIKWPQISIWSVKNVQQWTYTVQNVAV